jgi:hypothetical protein
LAQQRIKTANQQFSLNPQPKDKYRIIHASYILKEVQVGSVKTNPIVITFIVVF